jgi:hypothetical protein
MKEEEKNSLILPIRMYVCLKSKQHDTKKCLMLQRCGDTGNMVIVYVEYAMFTVTVNDI